MTLKAIVSYLHSKAERGDSFRPSHESNSESQALSPESRHESLKKKLKFRVTSRVTSHDGRVTSPGVKSRVTHESHKLSQELNHNSSFENGLLV